MKAPEGYTAAELAALALPGLKNARIVRLRASAEGWPSVSRPTRGGECRWYPLATLPESVQVGVAERVAQASSGGEAVSVDRAADDARLAVARERLAIVARVEAALEAGASLRDALSTVAAESETAARTIRRWRDRVRGLPRTEWLEALVPGWRGGGACAEVHEQAWAYFKADYLRGSKPGFRAVYRRLVDVAQKSGWTPIPSLDALKARFRREVPHETVVLKRQGPEALARLYPAQERDRTSFRVLEAINADGHRFDVQATWPDGSIGRPVIVAFQDLRSSKIVGWRIDKTENADLVRLAFADVVSQWGVPEHAYLDNGRGFASKWITGGSRWRFRFKVREEDVEGVMGAVGVKHIHWCTPYHGQSKPIEKAFGDLCESIARHPFCEGAYTGPSPVAKPHNYGTRTVEIGAFVEHVAAQLAEHNARPKREGANVRGRSFDDVFAEGYAEGPVQRASEAQQRMLLLAAERKRVRQGTGCVYLAENRYWAPGLAPLQGQDVILRFDPHRLHDRVYVYRLDGSYLCEAECQAPVGFGDATAARDHARQRSAWVKAKRAQAKAQVQFSPSELAQMHLDARIPERAAARAARPKVLRPLFGAPSGPARPVESPPESSTTPPASDPARAAGLIDELGRAAMSSGRLRPRRK